MDKRLNAYDILDAVEMSNRKIKRSVDKYITYLNDTKSGNNTYSFGDNAYRAIMSSFCGAIEGKDGMRLTDTQRWCSPRDLPDYRRYDNTIICFESDYTDLFGRVHNSQFTIVCKSNFIKESVWGGYTRISIREINNIECDLYSYIRNSEYQKLVGISSEQ